MIPRARMLLVERVVRNVNTSFELMNLWQMQCRPTPNNVRNILLILIILGNLKSEGCQTSLFFSCWYQYLNIIHRLNTSLLNRRFFFFLRYFGRAKVSAKRSRRTRHVRWGKRAEKITPLSRAPRSLCACLRSPEKRKKISPIMQAN